MTEITSVAQTFELDGITVHVRCLRSTGPSQRMELVLTSGKHTAVVDLAEVDLPVIPHRISQAALAFADTIRLGVKP